MTIMPQARNRVRCEQKLLQPKFQEPGKLSVNEDKIRSEMALQAYMDDTMNLHDLEMDTEISEMETFEPHRI